MTVNTQRVTVVKTRKFNSSRTLFKLLLPLTVTVTSPPVDLPYFCQHFFRDLCFKVDQDVWGDFLNVKETCQQKLCFFTSFWFSVVLSPLCLHVVQSVSRLDIADPLSCSCAHTHIQTHTHLPFHWLNTTYYMLL